MRRAAPVRVGNQTAFSADPLEPFDYAIRRHFDAFEWFPDRQPDGRGWSESDLSSPVRASIRRTAREHDIALSVHGAWNASPLTEAGSERLLGQVEFAAEIGASMFVAHPFVTGARLPAGGRADPADRADSIAPLVRRLAGRGIRLAVENTPETSASDVNALLGCLGSTGLPANAVGVCFDMGHANLCAETRNDYLAYLDRLAADAAIFHVHVHENWGDEDSHLTLFTGPAGRDGTGVVRLVDRLRRRQFSGSMILEQWPQPPDLLAIARDRLLQILEASSHGATAADAPPPWQPQRHGPS